MSKPEKKRMLVLCTGNSCRSQMAHGYLQKFGDGLWEVFSAGIETHGVNPQAIEVMKEDGIDIAHHTSDHIDRYKDYTFDFVLTVCDHARESCPWFPTTAVQIHHNFSDPGLATGTKDEVMTVFRNVRNEIKKFAKHFIEHNSAMIR